MLLGSYFIQQWQVPLSSRKKIGQSLILMVLIWFRQYSLCSSCFPLIVLPLGKIRLAGTEAKPEHSTYLVSIRLFAAGMGYWL